ncbi:MAG: glycosyltransferase family 39 protein [Chloroflexi bacterium]|nr:glycosyltransferase family 39 protein [Chloroflexota bacterium]
MRLYRLGEPVLRWDEGWSLAHASLPWADVLAIGSQEWHPPLYIALLKLWLVFGKSPVSIRLFSVVVSTLTIPLTYITAKEWAGSRRIALLAALVAALYPLLVYYGQVARMYALSACTVLLAGWFMLRELRTSSWGSLVGLVAASILSLYTFYLSAWALLGLWLYGVIARPKKCWRLLLAGIALIAAYLPWLWFTRSTLAGRLGTTPLFGADALRETLANVMPALQGLAFIYSARSWAAAALTVALVGGVAAGIRRHAPLKPLLLPLCVLGVGIIGTAFSARVYWFAVRHLLPIVPFFALALAWALDQLSRLWAPLLVAACLVLGIAYWPVSSSFVYEKSLEVTGPFDPSADYRYLAARAGSDDLVYYNVLAHAGWYEALRQPGDAPWSYALSWDPIIEPIDAVAARITHRTAPQQRLWFAQYQGNYGPNAPLTDWLAQNLYPAGAEWQDDMLYLAYTRASSDWISNTRGEVFGGAYALRSARWSAHLRADQALAVELDWSLAEPLAGDYKVFLHLVDDDGRLIAQHDGIPANGARPVSTWQPDELLNDRHAVFLPRELLSTGTRLHLLVGMYDAESGQRLLTSEGKDTLELAVITIE